MYDTKHQKLVNESRNTRSSHALVDRSMLKNIQTDISHASELIMSLREEREALKKSLKQLQQENHEKNSIIRTLKNKIKYMENFEEDDDIIKELNQANIKLKNEIEISLHGINPRNSEIINEIILLTESFLTTIKSSPNHYKIFKSHIKGSSEFKQIIGNEDWMQSTLFFFRFYNDLFAPKKVKIASPQPDSQPNSEDENYSNIIHESQQLLDSLSYQKYKLDHFNTEFSARGHKLSPIESGYKQSATEKSFVSPDPRKEFQGTNFHSSSKSTKNAIKSKQSSKK
jgi:hypothetical protein